MTTAFDLIMSGKIVEGIIYPFTNLMGNYFYVILYLLALIMIYNKNQSFSTAGIMGVLLGSIILPILPGEVHFIVFTMITLAITIILYRVFH